MPFAHAASACHRPPRARRCLRLSAARGLILALFALAALAIASPRALLADTGGQAVTLAHKGLTLNAKLVQAEGKTLADGVILITHGTLAHNGMEVIRAMQTALAERGWNSLAISLSLGLDKRTGMYDCATPHTHRHTDALDEIGAWLGWLKAKGAKRVVLMGHSRGGNQTAWFAVERPDPVVSQVVLLAPMRWSADEAAKSYAKRYGTPLAEVLARARKMVAAGKGDAFLEKVGFIYCKDAKVTAAAFVNYYAPDARRDTPSLLTRIKVPVLVIVGTEDQVVTGLVDAVKPIAAANEHVSLAVIEDADHFFRDFFAEDAADAIEAFLGG